MKIETERRRVGPQQWDHRRQPSGPQTVWMRPWRAGGVVGGTGRLREDSAPSEPPEGRSKITVTEMTAACLVPPLQGEHTEPCPRCRDQTRAGRIRVGHALGASDRRQQRQAEKNTGDPRAEAASGRQCDTTPISKERSRWTDDGCAVVRPGRATTGWGKDKGGT